MGRVNCSVINWKSRRKMYLIIIISCAKIWQDDVQHGTTSVNFLPLTKKTSWPRRVYLPNSFYPTGAHLHAYMNLSEGFTRRGREFLESLCANSLLLMFFFKYACTVRDALMIGGKPLPRSSIWENGAEISTCCRCSYRIHVIPRLD